MRAHATPVDKLQSFSISAEPYLKQDQLQFGAAALLVEAPLQRLGSSPVPHMTNFLL